MNLPERCPIDGDSRIVGSSGPSPCKGMIIGEHPAWQEVRSGRPFSGVSGELLDRMLTWVGLKRNDFYVTNARKCAGTKKEVCEECQGCLKQEIEEVNPEVILSAGAVARSLLDGKPSMASRGFVYPYDETRKIVGTLNPAAILHMPTTFDLFAYDVEKFKRVLEGKYKEDEVKAIEVEEEDYEQFFDMLHDASMVAFDLETDSFDLGCDILTISFAVSPDIGFVLEWKDEMIPYVKKFMESSVPKAAQNAFFDLSHLMLRGIKVKAVEFDTMIAHHLIRTYLPHDLNTIISIYTNLPKYDDLQKEMVKSKKHVGFHTIPKEVLYPYSAMDSAATFAIIEPLRQELKAKGYLEFFQTISMPLCPVLVRMRLKGIKVDRSRLGSIRSELDSELENLDEKLRNELGDINFNSGAQLGPALKALGIDTGVRTKKYKQMSTAKEPLEAVAHKYPIVQVLLNRKVKAKLRSTYVSDKILGFLDENDRVRPNWKQTGTVSIRLACEGPNLLNIPRGSVIRTMYSVEKGNLWVEGDLSQAELRIAATLANATILLEAFERGQDIHAVMASHMFDIPYEEIGHDDDERHRAKFIVHGRSYGRGHESVMSQYGVNEVTARDWIDKFDNVDPRLMEWYQETINEARKNRYLTTPYGNSRHWPIYADFDDRMEREARSFKPQSTAAIVIYQAMISLDSLLEREGFQTRMISNLYDAIMFEIPRAELKIVLPIIKREMSIKIPQIDLVIPVEFKVSDRWAGEPIEVEAVNA